MKCQLSKRAEKEEQGSLFKGSDTKGNVLEKMHTLTSDWCGVGETVT